MDYALITGASGVIGSAFCRELVFRGYNLFITGRSQEKLQGLKKSLVEAYPGVNCKIFAADLTKEEERLALFEEAAKLTFCLLVNCAGADIQRPFCEYSQAKLTFQTRINLESAISLCAFALAHRSKTLRIINISSVCGEQPTPYFAVYSACKGALTDFSMALNREVRGEGVSVTAVLPGSVYTRADVVEYIKSLGFWAKKAAKTPEYVVKKSLKAASKGRARCVPGGLNKLVCFLSGLTPRALRLSLAAKLRKDRRKDAF